jgi:hypothetical protein
MTKLRPYDKFPAWKSGTCLRRILMCAGALHVHDFLSDSERKRVQKRLRKWLLKNGVK